MSLTTEVVFRRGDISFNESNVTPTFTTFATQIPVSDVGWTLTHIQNGVYELVVPLATVKTVYSLADTATGLITADGILDPVVTGGDPWATPLPGLYPEGSAGYLLGNNLNSALFQSTLNRLLEQKVDGSLVVVNPSPLDDLILYQFNDYPEMELSLNPQWTTYLDGSYEIFFTIKENARDTVALVEVQGTIIDQASCTVGFALTIADMSVNPTKGIWQVQLRKPDPGDPTILISLKIATHGHVYIRPALKEPPEPVVAP